MHPIETRRGNVSDYTLECVRESQRAIGLHLTQWQERSDPVFYSALPITEEQACSLAEMAKGIAAQLQSACLIIDRAAVASSDMSAMCLREKAERRHDEPYLRQIDVYNRDFVAYCLED